MRQLYNRWNGKLDKLLRWIVVVGLLATLPLGYERLMTEQSAKTVELVFDYRDLQDIADYKANPQSYIREHLVKMKEIGITSIAVYESNLNELRVSRRIQLFNVKEAAMLTGSPLPMDENFTHLLFANREVEQVIAPLIEREFQRLGIAVHPWSYQERSGLVIEVPLETAIMKPLDPDPFTLQSLKDQGFDIAVRLSDSRTPFSTEDMDALLAKLSEFGVNSIIFGGKSVTGYADDASMRSLAAMAELMNTYKIKFATIEMQRTEQNGLKKLAYLTDYNVVRLHSLPEQESRESAKVISDRLVLAVKDRNIRMIYLHAGASRDSDKAEVSDSLENLYLGLKGSDGAIERIQAGGFTIGEAQPFTFVHSNWQKPLKMIVLVGGVALIALTIALYIPAFMLFTFLIGIAGVGGLAVLSSTLLSQAMALGVAICAPTLAVIWAVRTIRRRQCLFDERIRPYGATASAEQLKPGLWSTIQFTIGLFVRTVLISFIGVLFVVGLLNQITYSLVLEQFRGVSVLHLIPIMLVGIYIVFFGQELNFRQTLQKARSILLMNIKVFWVILAGVLGFGVMYYLSRTGNSGQVSSYERIFRTLLENNLGIRPRTKEFLLAHPLFIVATYFAFKYRNAVILLIVGVIGQLSIVDTFAHLHTPIDISFIRVIYGVLLGIIIGFIYIAIWEIAVRSWNRWAPSLRKL